jgi:hypothetical protein
MVTGDNFHASKSLFYLTPLNIGDVASWLVAIACLNDSCKKLTLTVALHKWPHRNMGGEQLGDRLQEWRLIPQSTAVPQPDFIPGALRSDYYEACSIRELSPKASATLSRRCLQGMIRDFCNIAKGTLDAEIKALRAALDSGQAPAGVTLESVEAIDQVRSIGNIGAHMEKDINLIIEVDEGEAEALTDLIEILFKEWYVARQERQQKLALIKAIAEEKKAKIAEGRAQQAQRLAEEQGGSAKATPDESC